MGVNHASTMERRRSEVLAESLWQCQHRRDCRMARTFNQGRLQRGDKSGTSGVSYAQRTGVRSISEGASRARLVGRRDRSRLDCKSRPCRPPHCWKVPRQAGAGAQHLQRSPPAARGQANRAAMPSCRREESRGGPLSRISQICPRCRPAGRSETASCADGLRAVPTRPDDAPATV